MRARAGTAAGQTWDLPAPVQGASAHARFFDHAGPFGPCAGASEPGALPPSERRCTPGMGGVVGGVEGDGVEGGVMAVSGGSKVITGAERFGFRATDGGLRPPPPTSVEPSGIPAGPTVDPGPMDEPKGGDAVADVAQVVGAVALMPPPSKSAVLDSPGTELPMPPDAPVVEPPIPADAPVIGLPIPVDAAVVGLPMAAGADEAPAHGAPIKGAAPDVVGLTPGVASSVAPRGIPVCPTGALGIPSGDVMPSAGRGETFRRACA